MEQILKLANDLGKQIAGSERFKALRQAELTVRNDAETHELLEAAERQGKLIAEKESAQKPIEPDDKHEMERLNEALSANENLQILARAQADYLQLMKRVDEAIREQLA